MLFHGTEAPLPGDHRRDGGARRVVVFHGQPAARGEETGGHGHEGPDDGEAVGAPEPVTNAVPTP